LSNRESPQDTLTERELDALAQKIVLVPDKLVTVQMHLEPLCNGDVEELPVEVRRALSEACSLLHSAIADVVEVARDLRGVSELDGKCPSEQRPAP
jgi:signal transduction histidine kinase